MLKSVPRKPKARKFSRAWRVSPRGRRRRDLALRCWDAEHRCVTCFL